MNKKTHNLVFDHPALNVSFRSSFYFTIWYSSVFWRYPSFAQESDEWAQLRGNIALASDPRSKAIAYYDAALFYHGELRLFDKSLLEKSLLYLDSALGVYQTEALPKEDSVLAKIFLHKGILSKFHADYQESAHSLELAKSHAIQGDTAFLVRVYQGLCIAYFQFSDYEKVFDLGYKALSLAEASQDQYRRARLLNILGAAYREVGDYQKSMEARQEALRYAQIVGDSTFLAMVLNNTGNLLINVKDYDSAIVLHRESIKIASLINDLRIFSVAHGGLAESYARKKNYDKAFENYTKALNLHKEQDNLYPMASVYYDLGSLLIESGDDRKGLEYLHKAIDLGEKIGHRINTKRANERLYKYYSNRGDFRKAFQYLSQYAILNDSILNSDNDRQLNNLQISYELDKKTREADLMKTENELKDVRLRATALQIRQQKVMLVAVLLVLVILLVAALVLYNYLKRRTREKQELLVLNRTITDQQQEIQKRHDELSATLDELRSTQDKLVESEKMASLGVLIAGIGHEINNPLNFINQSVLALNMKLKRGAINPMTDEIREFDGISEGVKRIAGIINSLRRFSRDSKVMDEACNLPDILEGCLEILNSKIKKKELNISKSYPEDAPIIQGNEGKLHQAFLNFISNAIDASDAKGEIQVSIEAKGDQWVVKVTDTGTGMDAETLRHIGDPFFTTKDPGQGTGLGIYISKDIIEAHQGEVHFESEVGRGTAVNIRLPVSRN